MIKRLGKKSKINGCIKCLLRGNTWNFYKRQKKKKEIFDIPAATIEKINQIINPTKH